MLFILLYQEKQTQLNKENNKKQKVNGQWLK